MTSENIMKERWDQLGLPPMELAESSENNSRANSGVYKCLPPLFHKLVIILLLTSFGVGTYVLLLRLSENYDYARNTEIIILTGNNEIPNVTVHNMEIFLEFKNGTADQNLRSKPKERRKKRHTSTPMVSSADMEDTIHFNDEQLQKAREIILNHDVLCNKEETQEICKNFVSKLKAIGENHDESKTKQNPSRIKLKVNEHDEHDAVDIKAKQNDFAPTDLTKREALPNSNLDSILKSVPTMHLEAKDASPYTNAKVLPHSHSISPQPLSETCLLARLLKQNYPSAKGIYDPSPAYSAPHYEHQLLPKSRYYSPDMHAPYLQERDIDLQGITMHPQDVNIVMSLLTSKSEPAATPRSSNSSREISCPTGTLPCLSGDACIEEKQWCDGNVDCIDVSDEARCACKTRVDKSRLCDGYFDCPFGEDEMGCYGCSETMFSCEDLDMNSRSTCFTKEQRCNNVVDCPNHKDEVECNMLAPSLLRKPLFAISNTEGFLHRNFKGDWFAVCKNPYMWAHDACRRETGLIIRPPFIQILPIDPMMKVDYLNTGPGGLIQTSDTCMNSSAVYVTCPDLLCGTRVQSTSQLLREDAAIENRLFGRNKRFLLKKHPYPLMFYGNRLKRDVEKTRTETNNYEIKFDRSKRDFFDTMRNKRTESRVVGGKPSQPAAWPWMVALYRNGMFHCGGVVITHSWVVSAAHCVHKFWDHYYEVQVGMLRRFSFSPQEKSHKVTHVIVNPHYSQTDMKNDLSLLKVEPAIQFSRWVRPICLPNPDTAGPDWLWGPAPGTICTSVGWGSTKEHGPDPDHMRDVEVPIWANCKHREDRVGNEICAGLVEGGRDACQGDSGGPLLCRNPLNSQQWYMAGIVSHGDGCGRKDEPGVYTRVSLFVKWIKYHISSKTLPKFQPIQECPGFKCETGISKCLPNKRKCDKIVDCLDGEDETNCEFTRSVTTLADSIFVDPKSSLEELLESKEVQTESPSTSSSDKNQEDTTPATIPSDNDVSTENEEIVTSKNIIHTSHKKRENFDLQSKESTHAEKKYLKQEKNTSQSKESIDTEKLDVERKGNPIDNPKSKESTNADKLDFENEEKINDKLQSKESTDAENIDFNHESNPIDNQKSKESTNANKLDFKNEENISDNLKSKESTDAEDLDFNHEGNPIDNPKSKESTNANKLDFKNEENISDNLRSKESTDAENLDFNHEGNPIDNPKSKESTNANKLDFKNEENISDNLKSKESTDAENLDFNHKGNPIDNPKSKESTNANKLDFKNGENISDNLKSKESTDAENLDFNHEGNPIDNPKSKESTNANKLDFKNEENISDNLRSKESTDAENLDFNHEGNPIDNPKSKESTNGNKLDFKNEENISDNLKSKESTDAENLDFNHEGNTIDNPKSKESTNANKLDFKNGENISDNLQSKKSTDAENLDFNHEDNPIDKPKSKESTDADELNVKNEKNLSDHPQSQESTVADIEHKENPTDHSQSEDSIDAEKQNLKHEENPITNTQLKKSTDTKKPDFEHASTIEIINDESSENFFNSEETATADPKSVTSIETTSPSRGDAEMITMDFSVVTLESGSSVLEQIKETTTQSQPNEPEDINSDSDDDNNKIENVFENKLETSTVAFTHNNFIEPIEKNEPTTPLTRPKNLPDINLGKKDENESGFLVKLLPNFNSTVTDKEGIETILINDDNNVTDSDLHQDSSTKKLPNVNDKSDTIKIEDLIFSDLQPAKVRRKHRNPNEFECRRIEQTIPYQHRCDRKADCEDGTDELDCTCTDFLLTFDENLICDGIIDCIDGQDELDCFSCPEDHFLCQRSQICLPEKHVCDGKTECLQGEDELNCFALTNGKDIEFDLDDRPTVNLEGYLTKKHFNDWHIVCDDKLSIEQQEEAATHICRYLGFSSANRYNVKYLNLKEVENAERSLDNKRNRRDTKKQVPIHFAYRQESEENDTRHTIIKDPQIIKEECIPNITKTCKSLYVFCDNSLFNNFDDSENRTIREAESVSNYAWPWIAKVFVEGDYRCTGVLVNLTWVLVSDSCLWDSTLSHHYITVVLGSHRTLGSMNGLHEQVYQVNSKKDVYRSKATLLHLREPAHYSNVVKPMVVASSNSLEQKSTCVAVGQDNKNNTISVFLEETSENCHPSNRCFKRKSSEYICPLDVSHHRHWAGIVSCHTEQGWYPAATFVDGRGECGLGDHINATDIENLKNEIKYHYGKKPVAGLSALIGKEYADDCAGIRCGRGRCVPLLQVCNGVRDCEDGNDEAEEACGKKNTMCNGDPYHKGCECSVGQMKCRNGKCISKELFRDGNNDCGDGTDEPGQTICKDYLATVMPSRLCDGILHCHDRSDEDPAFCKCFAKRNYKCGSKSDVDHCVAPDTVCDGVRDCPNGEDEQTCMALNAPYGTPYGTGQIIVRSHGVWHSKCYASQNHTKSELEAICSELGFFSGHAKQIKEMKNFVVHPYNNLVLDPFNEIILNNNTIIKMRNNHEPLAKAVFDEVLPNCYPVFIECR